MSVAQNWDGVTPPAMPAGWNVDAPFTTTATFSGGIAPTSSPNALQFSSATNGYFNATYGGANDGSNGNVIVQASFNWYQVGLHKARWGVTARGSASTLNFTATTYYTGYIDQALTSVGISKVVNGTQTTLGSVTPSSLTTSAWYTCILKLNGTALTLAIQRVADGLWLNPGGSWLGGIGQPACISIADSSISGAGYCGLIAGNDFGSASAYSDDWSMTPIAPASPLPTITVVPVPFQFFPSYQS